MSLFISPTNIRLSLLSLISLIKLLNFFGLNIFGILHWSDCSIVSIIAQIQNSKCKKIKGCGLECQREVPNDDN